MAVYKPTMEKFSPVLGQIAVRSAYAGMIILTKVAIRHGMNHFASVTYGQIIATLAIAPWAYVLERNQRPPMTWPIFFQTFLLALCGITINQNAFSAALHYTTCTFASAVLNLIPAITFLMATILRYETVDIRSLRGQAKVVGAIICVGGAMVMTLYKGPMIKMLKVYNSTSNDHDRILGCKLLFVSVLGWSTWIIFQSPVVNKYPAQLSLTALMCTLGAVQSGVIALIYEHKTSSVWAIGWNIVFVCYLYTGVMCSGFAFSVQMWCVHKKGPLFVAVFNPLNTVIVAILECFVLHINHDTGSVVGAILIVAALYLVLWGKAKDIENNEDSSTDADHSNNYNHNMVGDVDDEQIAIDIKRPLLRNGLA